MATPYSSPLRSHHERRDLSSTERRDPHIGTSAVSHWHSKDPQSDRIEDIWDPEICDSCSCDGDVGLSDTRFLTSMVSHQLPVPDTSEENEDLLLASIVVHMVCKLIGDEER